MIKRKRGEAIHLIKVEMLTKLYVLLFVCIANGAVSNEIGDIDVCDESSIIAQAGPFLSEKDVTQYANLEIFDAQ